MATGGAEETKNGAEQIHTRLRDLDDWKIRITWVGAGLVGLIALLAATGGAPSPETWTSIFRALTITFVLVSGGLLAYARANFEWAASLIEHELEANPKLKKTDGLDRLPGAMQEWPNRAEEAFRAALLLIILSGSTFFLSVLCSLIPCY